MQSLEELIPSSGDFKFYSILCFISMNKITVNWLSGDCIGWLVSGFITNWQVLLLSGSDCSVLGPCCCTLLCGCMAHADGLHVLLSIAFLIHSTSLHALLGGHWMEGWTLGLDFGMGGVQLSSGFASNWFLLFCRASSIGLSLSHSLHVPACAAGRSLDGRLDAGT